MDFTKNIEKLKYDATQNLPKTINSDSMKERDAGWITQFRQKMKCRYKMY